MKNILIHGLGQNSKDWDTIKNELETRGISSVAPDLFDLAKGRKLDYPTVSGIQRAVRVLPRQTKSLRAFPRRSACAQLCYPVSEKNKLSCFDRNAV